MVGMGMLVGVGGNQTIVGVLVSVGMGVGNSAGVGTLAKAGVQLLMPMKMIIWRKK
jgi:hypothetical protein